MDSLALSALEQAIDCTWGKASTNSNNGTMAIRTKVRGESNMTVMFITTLVLGSLSDQEAAMTEYYKDSAKAIDAYVKEIKKEFKELYGKPLKVKKIGDKPSIEIISHSHCNPRRLAYYRLFVDYEISS